MQDDTLASLLVRMAIRRSSWAKTHKPTGELAKRARHGYYVRSAEVGWPVTHANGHDAVAVKRRPGGQAPRS